jgi:hypothetical protein
MFKSILLLSKSDVSATMRILVALAFGAIAAGGVAVNPPPDGGYAGDTTAVGTNALFSLTTGLDNTAIGFEALNHNDSANYNTAAGYHALFRNTSGSGNTALGINALASNTTAPFNTAVGLNALYKNTTGNDNTATGHLAMYNNTTGYWNTAYGAFALNSNTVGYSNTATGYAALYRAIAYTNTANGYAALYSDTTGNGNTAMGSQALFKNTTGGVNTAVGAQALLNNLFGTENVGVGVFALSANVIGTSNVGVGSYSLQSNTGNENVAVGDAAGLHLTTGSGNVCIGSLVLGNAGESNTTRIRNISSTPQDSGLYVTVESIGGDKLGYVARVSSKRYKDDIKPMAESSKALYALHPVNFRYKPEINPDRAERFGLVAEDVDKINPDLVSHDAEGKPLTVRYESVNAMLLNEFLKEHKKVEELEATVARFAAAMKEQAAVIQEIKEHEATTRSAKLVKR